MRYVPAKSRPLYQRFQGSSRSEVFSCATASEPIEMLSTKPGLNCREFRNLGESPLLLRFPAAVSFAAGGLALVLEAAFFGAFRGSGGAAGSHRLCCHIKLRR